VQDCGNKNSRSALLRVNLYATVAFSSENTKRVAGGRLRNKEIEMNMNKEVSKEGMIWEIADVANRFRGEFISGLKANCDDEAVAKVYNALETARAKRDAEFRKEVVPFVAKGIVDGVIKPKPHANPDLRESDARDLGWGRKVLSWEYDYLMELSFEKIAAHKAENLDAYFNKLPEEQKNLLCELSLKKPEDDSIQDDDDTVIPY